MLWLSLEETSIPTQANITAVANFQHILIRGQTKSSWVAVGIPVEYSVSDEHAVETFATQSSAL